MPDTPDVDALVEEADRAASFLYDEDDWHERPYDGALDAHEALSDAIRALATLARKATTPQEEGYDYATAWQNQCADNLALNAEIESLQAALTAANARADEAEAERDELLHAIQGLRQVTPTLGRLARVSLKDFDLGPVECWDARVALAEAGERAVKRLDVLADRAEVRRGEIAAAAAREAVKHDE